MHVEACSIKTRRGASVFRVTLKVPRIGLFVPEFPAGALDAGTTMPRKACVKN